MDYDAITYAYGSIGVSTLICIGAVLYSGRVLKRMKNDINKIERILRKTNTIEAKVR